MKFTRVILGCLLMVLGMATGAEVSAVPLAALENTRRNPDTVLVVGRKLLDEFSNGSRVIPSITIELPYGPRDRLFDPRAIAGAGEGYYMQYVCAGKFGDVISMQVANT